MTVSELIELLQSLPPNSEIAVYEGDGDFWDSLAEIVVDPETKRVFLYGQFAKSLG